MARCFSDILDITGTDTFLARCHPIARRDLCPRKIWLERRHSRIDEQKALIILGNQRKTLHNQMALALEKIQEHLTKFIYSIFLHVSISSFAALAAAFNLGCMKVSFQAFLLCRTCCGLSSGMPECFLLTY